ncbi:hypothetical protein CSUI_005477, partial [Cystoisospora suis]
MRASGLPERPLPLRARNAAVRDIPCYRSDLTFRAVEPDPVLFPFLRHYMRHKDFGFPRTLFQIWLEEAGSAWFQEVWVVDLRDLSYEVRGRLARLLANSVDLASSTVSKPFLYLFGFARTRSDKDDPEKMRDIVGTHCRDRVFLRKYLTGEIIRIYLVAFAQYSSSGRSIPIPRPFSTANMIDLFTQQSSVNSLARSTDDSRANRSS